MLCGLRWYDPALGRWLSRDPTHYAGGANLYLYGLADPLSMLDPDGAVSDKVIAVSNSLAGYFDNLTFGATAYLRNHLATMGPAPTSIIDENSDHYRHGTYISIGAQLAATGGEYALKLSAARAAALARAANAARIAANAQKGLQFEQIARDVLNVSKNTYRICTVTMSGKAVTVIHDAETCTEIIEFKNVNQLSRSAQLEGEINYAISWEGDLG